MPDWIKVMTVDEPILDDMEVILTMLPVDELSVVKLLVKIAPVRPVTAKLSVESPIVMWPMAAELVPMLGVVTVQVSSVTVLEELLVRSTMPLVAMRVPLEIFKVGVECFDPPR